MKKGVPLHSLLRENGGSPGAEETMPGHRKERANVKNRKSFCRYENFSITLQSFSAVSGKAQPRTLKELQ